MGSVKDVSKKKFVVCSQGRPDVTIEAKGFYGDEQGIFFFDDEDNHVAAFSRAIWITVDWVGKAN